MTAIRACSDQAAHGLPSLVESNAQGNQAWAASVAVHALIFGYFETGRAQRRTGFDIGLGLC